VVIIKEKTEKKMETLMDNWNFMLKIENNDGTREDVASVGCHAVKSVGGKAFHEDSVKSVTVFDRNGKVYLYLRKGYPEKTVNIPSGENG
jgi:hypothetical protein